MKDKEYTQSFIPPSLRQLLQSEMTKCINGMQTSAHDSTVDPLNFHGHSTAQAISHASRHQRAPSRTMRRLGKETHKGLSMILFMCRAVFPLRENYDVDVLVLSRCSYKAHQRFGVQDGSIQCLQRYAN